MKTTQDQIFALLPPELAVKPQSLAGMEELHLRLGRPPTALKQGTETEIGENPVDKQALRKIIDRITGASLHAHTEELRRGYINYAGMRIGVCGEAVVQNGQLSAYRAIRSLNIRIPKEIYGICDGLYERLSRAAPGGVLIVSPPGGGKTTALRELIRLFSDGGRRVSVVDERGEIFGCGFETGAHTDVLTNVPKAEGALMLLRAMNPEIIAMDEISSPEDATAVETIGGCGVSVFATAHAAGADELCDRPVYKRLVENGLFRHCITIRNRCGVRSYTLGELGCGSRRGL